MSSECSVTVLVQQASSQTFFFLIIQSIPKKSAAQKILETQIGHYSMLWKKKNNFLTHILEKAETGTHKERLGDFFFTAEPLESEIIRLGAERVSISIRC